MGDKVIIGTAEGLTGHPIAITAPDGSTVFVTVEPIAPDTVRVTFSVDADATDNGEENHAG